MSFDSPLFIIFGIAAFCAHWCIILKVLSWGSGWGKLADYYTTTTLPSSLSTPWKYCNRTRLNRCQYKNIVKVNVSPEGLYMGVNMFFRPFHPMLKIPWDNVDIVREERKILFLKAEYTVVTISKANTTLMFPTFVYEAYQSLGNER